MACDLIVVNYGAAEDSLNAIRSARQYLRPLLNRVIVVENGTGQAEAFARHDCEVIEFGENKGFAAAVNEGMRASIRTKRPPRHAMLLNPDAYLLPGPWLSFFSWIVSEVAAAGPCVLTMNGAVQSSIYAEPVPSRIVMELLGAQSLAKRFGYSRRMPIVRSEAETLQGSCLVVTTEAWKKIGPFDEAFFMYHEETEWCLRAKDAGYVNIYDPSVSIVHRGGVNVPPGRELMYYRSAVTLAEKRLGAARAEKLRSNLKRAAALRAFVSSGAAKSAMRELAEKL